MTTTPPLKELQDKPYRGRIAPSPTGYLHLGHASTFKIAQERSQANNGTLVLRIEDLDPDRCKPHYSSAILEDLQLIGIHCHEGPFNQTDRLPLYHSAYEQLKKNNHIYPSSLSRKNNNTSLPPNWLFRVPKNQKIDFIDANYGPQSFIAGQDFDDFIVWRRENIPSYELAVVVDDHHMSITEVVRGADLLLSTARQLLLYQALDYPPPSFYHCSLIYDEDGKPLSKRNRSKSLRPNGYELIADLKTH